MKLKNLIIVILSGFCFAFLSCKNSELGDFDSKPNIIIVYADDMGWADVGFNGNTVYETPNLDKMANEGLIPLLLTALRRGRQC